MMNQNSRRSPRSRSALTPAVAALTALLGTAATEPDAHAFTTGGHFTATERGLKRAGFDMNGVRHVQAANYTVDHMVNLPSKILVSDGSWQRAANVARYFHFDGLCLTGYVEREFAFVDAAVKKVVLEAKARRDAKTILNAIGIASHAIQDFYSHSNFADVDWLAWKGSRVVTMDDAPRDVWESPLLTGRWAQPDDVKRLLTGQPSIGGPYGNAQESNFPRHGSSSKECSTSDGQEDCGVNHDGARRRNNLVAIMMAAEATFDLAERVRGLVGDVALWNEVMHPPAHDGVGSALARAQAMSMAAGQWGYETSENYVQIAIAFASTLTTDGWQGPWNNTLFSMWLAAPTAHAMGGGADPFPANSVPLFGVPLPMRPTPPVAATFAGGYDVLWGAKRGALDLGASGTNPLAGTLEVDNRTYRQLDILVKNGGLEIRMRADSGAILSGMLYATGANRDLAGYLRDGVTGVPDGFVATKRARAITPAIKPNTVLRN